MRRKKNIKKPATRCQYAPGSLTIMVQSHRFGQVDVLRKPMADVQLNPVGPGGSKQGKTDKSGLATFAQLKPGTYTVNLTLDKKLRPYYQVPAPQAVKVDRSDEGFDNFMVPFNWLEFLVKNPDDTPASDLANVLRCRPSGKQNWQKQQEGTLAQEKVVVDLVPAGAYLVDLKYLARPSWNKRKVLVGEAVELKVEVNGCEVGTKGTFEILPEHDLATTIERVQSNVTATAQGFELKATWTPVKGNLGKLTESRICFRATVKKASIFSASVPLEETQTFQVEDSAQQKLDLQLKLLFSDGSELTANVAGGTADVKVPWGCTIQRIELAGETERRARVKLDADEMATRTFQVL